MIYKNIIFWYFLPFFDAFWYFLTFFDVFRDLVGAFYSLIRKNFVKKAYNGGFARTNCVDFTEFLEKTPKTSWEWFLAISHSSNAVFYTIKILREINFEALKTASLTINSSVKSRKTQTPLSSSLVTDDVFVTS